MIDTGANAAAGQGQIATQTGANVGNALGYGGNAAAAGYNAIGAAGSNLANNLGGFAAYKGLYGNNTPTTAPENWNTTLPVTQTLTGL